MPVGRKKPYTARGIVRLPCARCGTRPALFQWNCCANANRWMPLCADCDVDLNRRTLEWLMGKQAAVPYIKAYKARVIVP